ncbi:MAG: hypothetical protein KIC94_13595 [Clostridiales bacterium]|nr:beta-ketoacyl synthase N-terminal-like domain-containing protein [uncultured Anaerosporobacter sp.]MBS5933895.1 hypothetical protein [Clostridiales bacterium]
MTRVVVTGVGVVTPQWVSADAFFQADIKKEKDAENYVERFDDFSVDKLCQEHNVRRNDFFTKIGLAALIQAADDAGLAPSLYEQERAGAVVATTYGPLETIRDYLEPVIKKGNDYASPSLFSNTVINASLGKFSIDFKLKGTSSMVCGMNPVMKAYEELKSGKADVIFVGGIDCLLDEIIDNCNWNKQKENSCTLSEGAGFMVLETLEHAKKRKATIYSEVAGYGCASDPLLLMDINKVDGDSLRYVMERAIESAQCSSNDVQMIELLANISEVFSEEKRAIDDLFKSNDLDIKIEKGKEIYGESFSCSEILAMIHANLALKKNKDLTGYVMANSMHIGGNVYSILFEKFQDTSL